MKKLFFFAVLLFSILIVNDASAGAKRFNGNITYIGLWDYEWHLHITDGRIVGGYPNGGSGRIVGGFYDEEFGDFTYTTFWPTQYAYPCWRIVTYSGTIDKVNKTVTLDKYSLGCNQVGNVNQTYPTTEWEENPYPTYP